MRRCSRPPSRPAGRRTCASRGVAAFAPASHLDAALPCPPDVHDARVALPASLRWSSMASPLPIRSIDPTEIASDSALALFPQIDQMCLTDLNAPSSFGGLAPADLTRPGADLEGLNTILAEQNPNLKIAAPVLLAQGLSDTTVPPLLTDRLDSELRKTGEQGDLPNLSRSRSRGRGERRRRRGQGVLQGPAEVALSRSWRTTTRRWSPTSTRSRTSI